MYKTKLLSAVLQTLEQSGCPLSITDIKAHLALQQMRPNKTSLYRILEKLKQKKTVEALQIAEGVTYYELKKTPHGHFICETCNGVECLSAPLPTSWFDVLQKQMPMRSVSHISLAVNGLCTQCTS